MIIKIISSIKRTVLYGWRMLFGALWQSDATPLRKKIKAVVLLATPGIILYLISFPTLSIFDRSVGKQIANALSISQTLSFGFFLCAVLGGFLAMSIRNKNTFNALPSPRTFFKWGSLGLAIYMVLLLAAIPYFNHHPNAILNLSFLGAGYVRANDQACEYGYSDYYKEFIVVCNGLAIINVPMNCTDDLTRFDPLIEEGDPFLQEICNPQNPNNHKHEATYHFYEEPLFLTSDFSSNFTADMKCGGYVYLSSDDPSNLGPYTTVIRSCTRTERLPGVYFNQGRCPTGAAGELVQYYAGQSSISREQTGPITNPLFKGLNEKGESNLRSVTIINDAENGLYYGLIFNTTSFGGMCSEPVINTTDGKKCYNIPEEFVPHSVYIFNWDPNFNNKQNREQGFTIFGLPTRDGDGTFQQRYVNINRDEIIGGITNGQTGYYLINTPLGTVLEDRGSIQETTSFPQPVPLFTPFAPITGEQGEEPEEEQGGS